MNVNVNVWKDGCARLWVTLTTRLLLSLDLAKDPDSDSEKTLMRPAGYGIIGWRSHESDYWCWEYCIFWVIWAHTLRVKVAALAEPPWESWSCECICPVKSPIQTLSDYMKGCFGWGTFLHVIGLQIDVTMMWCNARWSKIEGIHGCLAQGWSQGRH